MSAEEKNNFEETGGVSSHKKEKGTFSRKLITFLKNNKAATFLSLVIIIGFVWFSIKLYINEIHFNKEKTSLINQYESTIDSLQIKHYKIATEVFSWSVRSELLRNNAENLNQLLTVFVKESGASLVQIVNPEDKMVLLSSDRKFEGVSYSGNLNLDLNETATSVEGGIVKIVTPVMGFNNIIGILIVEVRID